jgi:hypothetical protein
MTVESPKSTDARDYDPVFLHSRREAVIIFCVWLAALLWTVPYCYLNGFTQNFEFQQFETVLGIPHWVFWGVAMPWLAADAFTIWFCFFYMVDDDLGEEGEAGA